MTQFTVVNHDTEQTFIEDSRADAEERAEAGIYDFGFDEDDIDIVQGAFEEYADVEVHEEPQPDGGEAAAVAATEPAQPDAQPEPADLPDEPNLTDDPFAWMPGDFVDQIDGTPTINRRGYAALGRKFGISAPDLTVRVGPEETGHTYCRVQATVVDDDGREYQNHGSAHVDRGDDPTLLLELATTRARKRALAGATGVGLIAVEELKNEL